MDEEHYTYKYILALIELIYSIIQASRLWFNEYTKTVTFNPVFKKCKTDLCLLYLVHELGTVIVIVYVYSMLVIVDIPSLLNTIECIKK